MLKRSAELALRQGVMRQVKVPETGCKAIQISSQVRNVSSFSHATFRNSKTLLTSTSGAIANMRTFSSDETQWNSQTKFDESDMHDAGNVTQATAANTENNTEIKAIGIGIARRYAAYTS